MQKKKLNLTPFVMLAVFVASVVLTFVFKSRYKENPKPLSFLGLFFSSFVAIEMLVLHISPPFCALILFLVSRRKNWYNGWYFTQSEFVHVAAFLLGFAPLFLAPYFGHFRLLLILCVLSAAANLPFIWIQRYNRPRILASKFLEQN